MPNHHEAAQGRPVWIFMVATAMATTVSTLAATAMVEAQAPAQPVAVTCDCEPAAAPAVAPVAPATPPVAPSAHEQLEDQLGEPVEPAVTPTKARRACKAKVEGALDRDVIRRIVAAHIGEVRHCYNEGLEHQPELAGRVVVQFVIGPEGKVTRSVAESDDIEGEVPACIATAVGRWLFPKPADGNDVAVSYPFVLEPG